MAAAITIGKSSSSFNSFFFQDGSPPTDMTEYFAAEESLLTHQERIKR